MRNSALVAIAFFGFPLACLGTERTDLALAASFEPQAPLVLSGLPEDGDGSLALARSSAFLPSNAQSLVAEHEAYEHGRRVSLAIWGLLAGAGGVAGAAKGVSMFRRRRRHRELLLQSLNEINDIDASVAGRGVPRCLPVNPYVDPASPNDLARQIQRAAEASKEFGRILGVIFFDLGDPPGDDQTEYATVWKTELAHLVLKFKACLRSTDHVAVLDNREIVVSIALLPGMTELVGIANRLREIGRNNVVFAPTFQDEAGFAIYPLCGYRGEELMDYARADYVSRQMPNFDNKIRRTDIVENSRVATSM